MTITTPGGYTIHFKDTLTYGDQMDISDMVLDGVTTTQEEARNRSFRLPALSGRKTQLKAFEILVQKIVRPDGTEITTSLLQEVRSMSSVDGQAVFDKIDQIINPESNNLDSGEKSTATTV
jgi:hypothetical protein